VSSTFASPIGGVLFSIEVTTNYYEISNYWKSFMAAVAGFAMTRYAPSLPPSLPPQANLIPPPPPCLPPGRARASRGRDGGEAPQRRLPPSLYSRRRGDGARRTRLYQSQGRPPSLPPSLPPSFQSWLWGRFTPINANPRRRYLLAAAVSLLSASLFFLPGPFYRLSLGETAERLLSPKVGP